MVLLFPRDVSSIRFRSIRGSRPVADVVGLSVQFGPARNRTVSGSSSGGPASPSASINLGQGAFKVRFSQLCAGL